jgi:hypothetical protein
VLTRGGSRLASANGDDPIASSGAYPDFYYSTGMMHD